MRAHRFTRSDFVKSVMAFLGSVMTASLGIPSIGYVVAHAFRKEADSWILLGPIKNFPIGVPTLFNFTIRTANGWEKTATSHQGFIVRMNDNRLLALSNVCTHLGCLVSWHSDLLHYVSPCHNGHFDLEGNVVKGPPPRPLDEYMTRITDGILYVHFPPLERMG